jgi:hypothetical protein
MGVKLGRQLKQTFFMNKTLETKTDGATVPLKSR